MSQARHSRSHQRWANTGPSAVPRARSFSNGIRARDRVAAHVMGSHATVLNEMSGCWLFGLHPRLPRMPGRLGLALPRDQTSYYFMTKSQPSSNSGIGIQDQSVIEDSKFYPEGLLEAKLCCAPPGLKHQSKTQSLHDESFTDKVKITIPSRLHSCFMMSAG